MNPAAPVTRIRMCGSLGVPVRRQLTDRLAAALARLADLLPAALNLFRAIEMWKCFVAAPLFDEGAAEVVQRVRLVQLAGALQLGECLTSDRLRLGPAALAEERRRLVGQRLAARVGGRGCRSGCRGRLTRGR